MYLNLLKSPLLRSVDESNRLLGRKVEIFLLSHHTRPILLTVPCMVLIYIMRNPCCFCGSRCLLSMPVVSFYLEFNIITQLPRTKQSCAAQKATGRIYFSVLKLQHVTDLEHAIKTSRFMLQKFKSLTFSAEYINYGNKNRRTISRNVTHKTITPIRHGLFLL